MTYDKEKQQIVIFVKLEAENFWHFCWKNDQNNWLMIKTVAD